ncbi:MAG: SPASM domain-containing protein [Planctomycetaceae bacterium]|nr:SPASM domain-containing protein [Planctomycetaceae bacterium]
MSHRPAVVGVIMDYMKLKEENRALSRQEIRDRSLRLESRPQFFWFDIYGPCNLECRHCQFVTHGRTSDQSVSDHVYDTVIKELMPTAYRCNLGGTNLGEMTIAPRFHDFIKDCLKHQVRVNLTTNGTRMDDRWFGDLIDALDIIGFSMEGIEDQFEFMRGFKFRFFRKHVEKVVAGRSARNANFRVEWRYCAHSDNIHQLPDMIRMAREIGVDRIQVMNLIPTLPEHKYKTLFYHRTLANRIFSEARQLAQELDFDINLPPQFDVGVFQKPSELVQLGQTGAAESGGCCSSAGGCGGGSNSKRLELAKCFFPWQTCSINELGNVKPCCVYWRSMGDLQKQSFDQVWNGRKFRKLRASINERSDSLCFSCRMPTFDSERNSSAAHLKAGAAELLKGLFSRQREEVVYSGVMHKDYDPEAETLPIVKRVAASSCESVKEETAVEV